MNYKKFAKQKNHSHAISDDEKKKWNESVKSVNIRSKKRLTHRVCLNVIGDDGPEENEDPRRKGNRWLNLLHFIPMAVILEIDWKHCQDRYVGHLKCCGYQNYSSC